MSRSFQVFLVVVILVVCWGIIMPGLYSGSGHRPTGAKGDIASLETAINRFHADCGYYPTSPHLLPSRGLGGDEASGALIKRPAEISERLWHGPYLDARKPWNDPWGRPYVYECPGKHNTNGFDVYSLGANGKGGG